LQSFLPTLPPADSASCRPPARYLAWSLKRSKAVNGTRAVVGVVGKGHMRGVAWALTHDAHALRFSDLVGGRNSRAGRRQAALRRLAWEVALGVGCWAAWVAATGGFAGQGL